MHAPFADKAKTWVSDLSIVALLTLISSFAHPRYICEGFPEHDPFEDLRVALFTTSIATSAIGSDHQIIGVYTDMCANSVRTLVAVSVAVLSNYDRLEPHGSASLN